MTCFSDLIDEEFEIIKINLLNTSKINIFSKAEEIYHKSVIRDFLIKNEADFSERECNIIFGLDSFIDDIYEIILNKKLKFNENNIVKRGHEVVSKRLKKDGRI